MMGGRIEFPVLTREYLISFPLTAEDEEVYKESTARYRGEKFEIHNSPFLMMLNCLV